MSHMQVEALRALMEQQLSARPEAIREGWARYAGLGDLASPIDTQATESECEDSEALLDLASLSDGHLSAEGMRRLAWHLCNCGSCRAVFASMVEEVIGADATGTHDVRRFHITREPRIKSATQADADCRVTSLDDH